MFKGCFLSRKAVRLIAVVFPILLLSQLCVAEKTINYIRCTRSQHLSVRWAPEYYSKYCDVRERGSRGGGGLNWPPMMPRERHASLLDMGCVFFFHRRRLASDVSVGNFLLILDRPAVVYSQKYVPEIGCLWPEICARNMLLIARNMCQKQVAYSQNYVPETCCL